MGLVSAHQPLLKPSLTHPGLANPWLPVPFWPLALLGASFKCRTATVRAVAARYSRSGPSWVMGWIRGSCMSLKPTVAGSTVTIASGLVVYGKSTGEGWVLNDGLYNRHNRVHSSCRWLSDATMTTWSCYIHQYTHRLPYRPVEGAILCGLGAPAA